MIRLFFLVPTLALLAACNESSPSVADPEKAQPTPGLATTTGGQVTWGKAVLNLVPSRSGESMTSDAEVRAQFPACKFGTDGLAARSGDCSVEQLIPDRPNGVDKLGLQILSEGRTIAALRFVLCCTTELVHPFQGEPVIRAERLCPEVTLVATQSSHVFRVSAAGKRDFIHAKISHADGSKTVVSHTVLMAPSEVGSECTDVVTAEKALDAQFGAPTAR